MAISTNLRNVMDAIYAVTLADTQDSHLLLELHNLVKSLELSDKPLPENLDSYGLTSEEVSCLMVNKKINAIKLLRERTNMSLADAKEKVELHPACQSLKYYRDYQEKR